MTYMMKKQSSTGSSRRGGETLGMQRESRVISRVQPPKIRVIHIFPPEIIYTDPANFRELVQRLTGKNGSKSKGKGKKIKQEMAADEIRYDQPTVINPKVEMMSVMGTPGSSSSPSSSLSDHHHHNYHDHHQHHEQYYNWRASSSSSGDHEFDHNDHHNILSNGGGGFLSALEVDDDGIDFDSLLNLGQADANFSQDRLNLFGDRIY